jgi:hypothetical protein
MTENPKNNPENPDNPTKLEPIPADFMGVINLLKNEITQLKEQLVNSSTTKKVENDAVEIERKKNLDNEVLMKKARAEVALEGLMKTFDTTYSSYVNKAEIELINRANMNDSHKLVRKIREMFKIKSNYEALPPSRKNDVDALLNMNQSEEGNYNFVENYDKINSLLEDFSTNKKKIDMIEAKSKYSSGVVNLELSNKVTSNFWGKTV